MRKALVSVIGCVLVCCIAAGPLAGATASSLKQLKRQQKAQLKQLKIEQKLWKRSYRGRSIPRAERLAEKHQFQRNFRTLRLQQKNQIQQLKDQQRLMKYRNSHPVY